MSPVWSEFFQRDEIKADFGVGGPTLPMRPLSLHQIAGGSGTFKICTLPSWAVWFRPSFMIAGYEVVTPISMTLKKVEMY